MRGCMRRDGASERELASERRGTCASAATSDRQMPGGSNSGCWSLSQLMTSPRRRCAMISSSLASSALTTPMRSYHDLEEPVDFGHGRLITPKPFVPQPLL